MKLRTAKKIVEIFLYEWFTRTVNNTHKTSARLKALSIVNGDTYNKCRQKAWSKSLEIEKHVQVS